MRRRTVAAGFFSLAVAAVPVGTHAQLAAAPASSATFFEQSAPIGEELSDRGLFLCESVLVPWMSVVPATSIDAAALPGIAGNRFGGYLRIPQTTRPSCDATVGEGAVLSAPRVFVIGRADSTIFAAAAERNPGGRREIELGDLRLPFVRVGFVPSSKIEIEAVVNRRPQLGIFNALFTPAAARPAASGGSAVALVAETTQKTPRMPSPPALQVPRVVAFGAPIEERLVARRPIPPAPIEERTVAVLPAIPVEERVIVARALVPAAVEERLIVHAAAPVEERVVVAVGLVPAPVEDRFIESPAAAPDAAVAEAAPRAPELPPVQVASAAPVPVVVVPAAKPAEAQLVRPVARRFKEITIAAPPPRLIQNMFDRRGGSFFM